MLLVKIYDVVVVISDFWSTQKKNSYIEEDYTRNNTAMSAVEMSIGLKKEQTFNNG